MKKYACDCCEYLTIEEPGMYEICPICGWEDQDQLFSDPEDAETSPNHMTLAEAQENYRHFGCCKLHGTGCRPALRSEVPQDLIDEMEADGVPLAREISDDDRIDYTNGHL
jgi:hypothetical protein